MANCCLFTCVLVRFISFLLSFTLNLAGCRYLILLFYCVLCVSHRFINRVSTTLTSSKTIHKVDEIRSDPTLSCKNIKCPPIEDRVCVKVTKIDKQKHEKFILAINKCNMQFMKCHHAGNKHDVTLCGVRKGNEHHLRKIPEESSYELEGYTKNKNKLLNDAEDDEYKNIFDEVEKQSRNIANANSNDKVESELGDVNDDMGEEDDKEKQPAGDNDELSDINSKVEPLSDIYDDPGVEDNKEMKPADDIDRPDEKNEEKPDNDSKYSFGDNNDNLGDENKQLDLSSVKFDERYDEYKGEDAEEDNKPLNMQEDEDEEDTNVLPGDYDQNTSENVNSNEFKKNCPTQCPARDVMVCAKCQHHIYRSFLSSCHLRAFSCKHLGEKLELVNRKPCIQSAPFLTDLPAPKGKLSEQSDKDIVLEFIRCREKGRLYKDDPRCKF